MAYTTVDDPEKYFQTKAYTGNGSDGNAITFDGTSDMQPDLLWFKGRAAPDSGSAAHRLLDTVRGITQALPSHDTDGQFVESGDGISSVDSDGFTLQINSGNDYNSNTKTYVCWAWKAGTSFSNDASSTGIGSIDSSGSFNNDAGFSIVSYVGTGSNATVKHGLNAAPAWILFKDTSGTKDWFVYHQSYSPATGGKLNLTANPSADASYFQNTAPTTSVFSIGSANTVNASSNNMIAYCFVEKPGYTKFGTYTGNDNANGTFVHTGFAPAWVMIKRTNSVNDWIILDTKRNPINPSDERILANTNAAASTANTMVDFLSTGFKPRSTYGGINGDGDTFIYMAFAESPLVSSNGIPVNAR